ncbi:peptidyl-prolyl cis-trans isomerase FKBP8 [Nephila pilipes]|uniref:peptidylprolyl isomerase n=1 Tax=Nephila pilipes TaxID=299642 RepID=A0A8X6QYU5_NEPPI|nr:peptidyl-prolyl cis-trans isomerase FKBP8 [Nephila pilipes]
MAEAEQAEKVHNSLGLEKSDKKISDVENCTFHDKSRLSEMSTEDNRLENSTVIPNSSQTFQESREMEAEIEQKIHNVSSDILETSSDNLNDTTEEDGWLDLKDSRDFFKKEIDEIDAERNPEIENASLDAQDLAEDEWLDISGSGNFKKKIIKKGLGQDTRPFRGDLVIADISLYAKSVLIEENRDLKFIVGDLDVLQGIDLVAHLMEKGEKAKVIIPPKLAYGKKGRLPHVTPDTEIECDIEIKEVQRVDMDSLSAAEKLQYGSDKRLRGNTYYERGDYVDAVHCYERAIAYLDSIHDCSGMSTEDSQEIVNMRIKVHNNLAASHLKLSAYSAALNSVELVLKVQPKNVKALFRKAKILGAQGSTDEAIVCLSLAANLEPDTKEGYW